MKTGDLSINLTCKYRFPSLSASRWSGTKSFFSISLISRSTTPAYYTNWTLEKNGPFRFSTERCLVTYRRIRRSKAGQSQQTINWDSCPHNSATFSIKGGKLEWRAKALLCLQSHNSWSKAGNKNQLRMQGVQRWLMCSTVFRSLSHVETFLIKIML